MNIYKVVVAIYISYNMVNIGCIDNQGDVNTERS